VRARRLPWARVFPCAEASLSHRASRLARPHLLLRFAAMECVTQVSLATCELARAAREAAAAAALVARFPVLLAEARGAARHLSGLCAHSSGDYSAAVAHFAAAEAVRVCAQRCAAARCMCSVQRACVATDWRVREPLPPSLSLCVQCVEAPLRALCRVQRALSLLCAGAPGCESAALDALGALARTPDEAPGFGEASGALFASALASLRRGDTADAKPRLSRALKCAHGELGNHELVSQVLNALGALVESQGDPGQARDMLMSAFTLSKSASDVHAQAGALRVLSRVHHATGAAKEATDMERYAAKKKGALATLCADARAAAADAAVA
jgi:hypothetical protein